MELKHTFNKQSLSIAFVALILGAALGAYFHKETIVARPGTADTQAALSSVNLMIDYGNGTIKTWNTVSWHETMSVLDLVNTVAGVNAIKLTTKDIGNKLSTVESIDGIVNEAGKEMRWQYWINNTYEPRTANKYFLKPGDIVVWKYVKEQQEPVPVKK